MPLPVPKLDDRTWQDLKDEVLARVPSRMKEWTNLLPSDPGVAVVELFAYFVETILSRLNQVPDKMFLTFLNLIGVDIIPATYAKADVQFTLGTPLEFDYVISSGTEVATVQTDQQDAIVYRTDQALVIPAGQTVGVVSATSTVAGTAGRVGGNTLIVLKNPLPYVDRVTNPAPSTGGDDAETLEEAKARGPTGIKNQDRAVTPEDHEELARTASTSVSRAIAWANCNPAYPDQELEGNTTVVIVPKGGGVPDSGLISQVAAFLDQKRLLSTRLYVVAPQYKAIDVTVTVAQVPGAVSTDVQTAIQEALTAYLNPETWPTGRPVYPYELASVIDAAPGVDHVQQLTAPTETITFGKLEIPRPGAFAITVI